MLMLMKHGAPLACMYIFMYVSTVPVFVKNKKTGEGHVLFSAYPQPQGKLVWNSSITD